MKLAGDIAYFVAILGINAMLVFFLLLTQWRKSFMSIAITVFFGVVAVILDLSASMLFIESIRGFIYAYVRTPLYMVLAASIWTLVWAALDEARDGNIRRGKNKKVEITPPKK